MIGYSGSILPIDYKKDVVFKVRFIIGQVSEGDFELLSGGDKVTIKMIISRDDFAIFHYKIHDSIEIETHAGNRMMCRILGLESIPDEERVLLIFALEKFN